MAGLDPRAEASLVVDVTEQVMIGLAVIKMDEPAVTVEKVETAEILVGVVIVVVVAEQSWSALATLE